MTVIQQVESLTQLLDYEEPVIHLTARAVSDLLHLSAGRDISAAALKVFDGRPLVGSIYQRSGGENWAMLGRFWSHWA